MAFLSMVSGKSFVEAMSVIDGLKTGPQDSTPSQWDVTYYSEIGSHSKGVYSFESDINLSNPNSTVGQVFQSFVNSQSEFVPSSFPKYVCG